MTAALPREGWSAALQRSAPLLTGLLVLAGAVGLWPWSQDRVVRRLILVGEFRHLDPAQVREVLRPFLGVELLAVDLALAREAVAALPWVESVRLTRAWPDALRVVIRERSAYARWNEDEALDTGARRFRPPLAQLAADLPRLAGPEGREAEVMETYRQLAAGLADSPFPLSGLQRDARGEWTARTRDGIELRLGREAPLDKLGLLRGAAARQLAPRRQEVAYIDLRYGNGFAVGWARETAPAARPE